MNTHQETGKLKWSRNRGYASNSNKGGKEPIMKTLTINRSHFFNRFICLPVALVLIFTATVQAADKPPVTSAERVQNRIGLIGVPMLAITEYIQNPNIIKLVLIPTSLNWY